MFRNCLSARRSSTGRIRNDAVNLRVRSKPSSGPIRPYASASSNAWAFRLAAYAASAISTLSLLPSNRQGRPDLIEPRGMIQVEQAIDLRAMPAQPPGEIGLADPALAHRPVEQHLGRGEGGQDHAWPISPCGRRRQRDRLPIVDPRREHGLERALRAQQSIALVLAKGHGLRKVGEGGPGVSRWCLVRDQLGTPASDPPTSSLQLAHGVFERSSAGLGLGSGPASPGAFQLARRRRAAA